ncbi:NAD(P)-binding protein, partial [Prevotella denticola]
MKTAVIIGGGLGGLFTGALLSHEGFKVTVLEKNSTAGGGLQNFRRFGMKFDTGMHIIGGMHPGGNIYRICQYLGIADRVQLR